MRRLLTALVFVALPGAARAQQAPWLIADVALLTDNQPRTALHSSLEYGRWLSRAVTLGVTLQADHLAGDDVPSSTTWQPGLRGTLGIARARTGIRAGASLLLGATATTALGHAEVSTALGAGTSLRLRAHRERYAATLAALDTVVVQRRLQLALDRAAAPGFAGELLARVEDYGDDNSVRTAYGWLLAPLSRSARHALRAGYAAAWQDAENSRWTSVNAAGTGDVVPGRFDPYHTPHDAVTHSVIADAALLLGATWLKADASYGFHATDRAGTWVRTSPSPQAAPVLLFHERSFSPYGARLSAYAPVGARASVTVTAHLTKTAFYRESGVRVVLARALGR